MQDMMTVHRTVHRKDIVDVREDMMMVQETACTCGGLQRGYTVVYERSYGGELYERSGGYESCYDGGLLEGYIVVSGGYDRCYRSS